MGSEWGSTDARASAVGKWWVNAPSGRVSGLP
jgi:hypothetical protein